MNSNVGWYEGLTMPSHDSMDTFLTWHIALVIGLWKLWHMPKVRILKIHYEESLINLRLQVRIDRKTEVFEWSSMCFLIPKLVIVFSITWFMDILEAIVGPHLLRLHHNETALRQMYAEAAARYYGQL